VVNHAAIVADRASGLHDWRPIQAESIRLLDPYIDNLANKFVAALEHDDFVRPCAAH
jgi:hypothetical protein